LDIVARLLQDRPIFHSKGTKRWDASPGTLRAIQQSVHGGTRTLETGCGASTVVFAAQRAYHTAISPDAEEHERVRDYLKGIDVDDSRLISIVGWSDSVLPNLCTERTLDIAFIDGAHGFPYPVVDWHYVTRALKVGGKLLIDDIPIPAVACVFRFMQPDPRWRLEAVLEERAAIFALIHEPPLEMTDWTYQPFNNHWDFGFAPLPSRARLILARETSRLRQKVGLRYPGLRQAWRRVSRASNASD
jgi:methyltransferase family protein